MEALKAIVEALDKGLKAGAFGFHEANAYIGASQHIERELMELQKLREQRQPEAELEKVD